MKALPGLLGAALLCLPALADDKALWMQVEWTM